MHSSAAIQAGLEKLPDPAQTGIPVIVAAELWTGAKKNIKTHPHHGAKKTGSGENGTKISRVWDAGRASDFGAD